MAGLLQDHPGGRQWLLALLALRFLLPTGIIVYLGASTVQGLLASKGVLGGSHAPTSYPFIEELYPEMLIYSGRPPRKYSLLQVENMNGSMDGRKQLGQRKHIRMAGSSSAPSKSPGKPVGLMRPWKPGTRGQGWDPGGQRPPEHPFLHGQPHSAHSRIKPWPNSHSRTRPRTLPLSISQPQLLLWTLGISRLSDISWADRYSQACPGDIEGQQAVTVIRLTLQQERVILASEKWHKVSTKAAESSD